MIRGVSHITFAVRDLQRSIDFYGEVLGFRLVMRSDISVYFSAGDLWFCVVEDPATPQDVRAEYTHIAFDVAAEDHEALRARIVASGARIFQENRTEGESLYFVDPDGYKLEIHSGDLHSRLAAMRESPRANARILDVPSG